MKRNIVVAILVCFCSAGVVVVGGCGSGHHAPANADSDGYIWTALPTDNALQAMFVGDTFLESLPAGDYYGDFHMEQAGYTSSAIKATVDSEGNLVGTVDYLGVEHPYPPIATGSFSGKPVFDGSNFNDNWRHYETHFHRPYPTMLIDKGDGNGPQPHEVIFDRPVQPAENPKETIVVFYVDPNKYKGVANYATGYLYTYAKN